MLISLSSCTLATTSASHPCCLSPNNLEGQGFTAPYFLSVETKVIRTKLSSAFRLCHVFHSTLFDEGVFQDALPH
jgi:hypothetical protein